MIDAQDKRYMAIIVNAIEVCADYKPRMGQGRSGGVSLEEFQKLYQSDPFYAWFGLDHPLMYAAHKAGGGMTSIYRQIGIGCERVIRRVLQDQFGLSETESNWSYTVVTANKRERKLSLDGRIPLAAVKDEDKRERVSNWIALAAKDLGVDPEIAKSLKGPVFEVRQGYKSKDSKRQNADIANAATAYTQAYLPCAMIMSTQIDGDIAARYRNEKWVILTGLLGSASALTSTYQFMKDVVGYDLAGFFQRNSKELRNRIDSVLHALLEPK